MKKNVLLIGIVALLMPVFTSCSPGNNPPDPQVFNIVAYCNSLLGKTPTEIEASATDNNFVTEWIRDVLAIYAYNEGETEPYMRILTMYYNNYCDEVSVVRYNNNDEELYREWRDVVLPTVNIPAALDTLSSDMSLVVYICSLNYYDFIQVQYLQQYDSLWAYCYNPDLIAENNYDNCVKVEIEESTYPTLKEKVIADYNNYILQSSKLTAQEFINSYTDEFFTLETDSETELSDMTLSINFAEHKFSYNISHYDISH
ncbi:MAG: hypothetical protein ACI3Z5_02500 [Paludibacteraceae bacterium]